MNFLHGGIKNTDVIKLTIVRWEDYPEGLNIIKEFL